MAVVGVQLMMLRDRINEKGMFGVLEQVRELGLDAVEVSQVAMTDELIADLERGTKELFAHVRQAVADLSLEPDAVGPLVTLGWLHHAQSPAHRRERLRIAGAEEDTDRGVLSSIARPWLRDPALGFGWR